MKPKGVFDLYYEETEDELEKKQIDFQEAFYKRYLKNSSEALLFLGFSHKTIPLSESLYYISLISALFVKKLSKNPDIELLREKTQVDIEEEDILYLLSNAPYINGDEYLNKDWILNLWGKMNRGFCKAIKNYKGSVEEFFASYNSNINIAGRIFFHLVESKKEEYPFAFMATYSQESKDGKSKHFPLKNALIDYGKNSRKLLELLSTVNRASKKSPFISGLIESGEIFYPISFSSQEAYNFLKEIPIYEEAGILCRIPNWWKSKSNSIKVSINVGSKAPSYLGYDAIVDFDVELSLGGERITVEELKKIIAEAEGLAFIKGKWVEVDHEKLKEALRAYEQAQKLMEKTDINMIEAMRFQLNAEKMLKVSEDDIELEVTNGEWLNSVIKSLIKPDAIEPIQCGDSFKADLRPYQETGLSWLNFMKNLRLGACLADDMGLGKTVQVLALLNYIKAKRHEKALLVIPASLIGNWKNEIEKFTPNFKYYIIHPSENKNLEKEEIQSFDSFDIFITTYGMLLKYDYLKDITWDTLILDEAQAIKNPSTKQTKAVKSLKATYKIAMTGTPIENRLSDLWSLFDFLNKGLLGSKKEFRDYAQKLKEIHNGYDRLKRVVSPFILRRLKTDKAVISDLPEKIEMKTYSNLSKKQAVLYNSLVKELKKNLESSEEGIERKGLVLSYLMKFKQICNHPDQYLGQNYYAEDESGKYERLREICETIYSKRERVIVFTQFKEITEPLRAFLETIFNHKGLILHGSTAISKRKDIVNKFQGDELSLIHI